ncbi:MAG TPA: phosphodiester glycosidase family protein [Flavisolibacter sp.]|nr:phosphodiester glycosidase family protein [Flavisolibacter sp.]
MPFFLTLILSFFITHHTQRTDPVFETRIVSPSKIAILWKDGQGKKITSFQKLKQVVPDVSYAMNGGIYMADLTPCGLLVQEGRKLRPLKILKGGKDNFSMQPQGVFAITKSGKAIIVAATDAKPHEYNYATQSAPMLVINGQVNPRLTRSESAVVRNGVGILPDGRVLLVLSKWRVTFQEFARFFIGQNCTAAMYMDGAVSESCDYTKELGDPYNAKSVYILIRK